MGHVDDAHDAEGDGEANGGQQQHRAERQTVPGVLHAGPDRERTLDRGDGAGRGLGNARRLIAAADLGQQRQRFLIAARPDGRDGLELVDLAGIGLEQENGGARLGQRLFDAAVGFLGERRVHRRQRRLVMRLEHGFRRRQPRDHVRRQQGQAAQRGVDTAAQAIVEAHRRGIVGQLVDGRAGGRIDDLAVGLLDIDLLGLGIEHQPLVLQRADYRIGQRIARHRDLAHRIIGVGEIVIGEFGDGLFEAGGEGRNGRDDQGNG